MTNRTPAEVFHPGGYMREEMVAREIGYKELAQKLRCPVGLLRDLMLSRTKLTFDMAENLGRVWGQDPQTWINLQAAWDAKQPTESEES